MIDRNAYFDAIRKSLFRGRMSASNVAGQTAILREWGTRDPRQLAYVLATAYHETAHTMQPIYERGARRYFDKYEPGTKAGKVLGNTQPGDGYLYRGRGFVQITGRDNYARMGRRIDVGLVGKPDLALETNVAADILVTGMIDGMFTGQKLSDYITPSRAGYVNARRIVNGTDRAKAIAGYATTFYEALLSAEKPTPKPLPKPVAPQAPVEATSKPELVEALVVGSEGPRVTALQTELKRLNYPVGGLDGKYGNLTRDAVMAFQADNGLVTDGKAGEKTWQVLEIANPRPLMAERTTATEKELVAKGDVTADSASKSKKGAWAAIVAGATTVGTKVADSAGALANLPLEPLRYGFEVWGPWLFGTVIVGAGIFFLVQAKRGSAARLRDYQTANISNVGAGGDE